MERKSDGSPKLSRLELSITNVWADYLDSFRAVAKINRPAEQSPRRIASDLNCEKSGYFKFLILSKTTQHTAIIN